MHLYCLRHFYIGKLASFSYHFIPASLPTRKASELQKLVARQIEKLMGHMILIGNHKLFLAIQGIIVLGNRLNCTSSAAPRAISCCSCNFSQSARKSVLPKFTADSNKVQSIMPHLLTVLVDPSQLLTGNSSEETPPPPKTK